MALILEVKAGPAAGKRVAVMNGQTVTVGRAGDRADFALPHDTYMSGLHFAVECGPSGCKLTDRKSANGTFVNGARVGEMLLSNGDEIRSGQTIFTVRAVEEAPLPDLRPHRPAAPPSPPQPPHLPPNPAPLRAQSEISSVPEERKPNPLPSVPQYASHGPGQVQPKKTAPGPVLLTMGAWGFSVIPQGWTPQGEYGLQLSSEDSFPSSAVVSAEPLGNAPLRDYVEAQLGMLRQRLGEPQIEAILPPQIHGAEETAAVEVRYKVKDGQTVFYRRIYARAAGTVGVLNFTTLERELPRVVSAFDAIASSASFTPASSST